MNSWVRAPLDEELREVSLGSAPTRATQAGRRLSGVELPTRTDVVGVGERGELQEELFAGVKPGGSQCLEVVGAEVLRDRVGRARCAECPTKLRLRRTEVALETVGARRDLRVVEAGEDLAPVSLSDAGDMIYERARRGAESGPGHLVLEAAQERGKTPLRLGGVLWAIGSVGIGRDLVSDGSQDVDVPVDAPGGADSVPVGLQCRVEALEDCVWAPFFRVASWTTARTSSSRW